MLVLIRLQSQIQKVVALLRLAV